MADRRPTSERFKREALPHDVEPYRAKACSADMASFETQYPFPFLLYARSKLWDPTLVVARRATAGGDETRLVDYNVGVGGMTFLSPIRKVQSDPRMQLITLGRGIDNDVVVPVSSVSTKHAKFLPPGGGGPAWTVIDLGSRNGTFLNEERIKSERPTELQDSIYLRLGGNLIAWFLYPGRLWQLLNTPQELTKLTDL